MRHPRRETELRVSDFDTVEPIIVANHYSHTVPAGKIRSDLYKYVVLYRGEVSGAICLGYGNNPARNGYTTGRHIQFDRMWLSDDMPHLSETVVLGLLHAYLRRAHPRLRWITTYSDTGEGNPGTIYLAANYRPCGYTSNPFWLLPSGRKVHAITLWNWHGAVGNMRDFMAREYPGAVKLQGEQRRFIYDLWPRSKDFTGHEYLPKSYRGPRPPGAP